MTRKLHAAAALVVAAAFCWAGCKAASLAAVEAGIRKKFPHVARVSTGALAGEMERGPGPALLDVRTPEEFAVSHLRGARRIDPDAPPAALAELPKDADIVTYCSVGYRSAGLAERLRAAGYTRVRNLEGSIFQWANEGRPVYRDGQQVEQVEQVEQVHPYNATWGKLLKPRLRSGQGS